MCESGILGLKNKMNAKELTYLSEWIIIHICIFLDKPTNCYLTMILTESHFKSLDIRMLIFRE